jgi:hypothetical protein
MSPQHLRLYLAASVTSLATLAFIAAGASSGPGVLLMAVISLAPPIMMTLWVKQFGYQREGIRATEKRR